MDYVRFLLMLMCFPVQALTDEHIDMPMLVNSDHIFINDLKKGARNSIGTSTMALLYQRHDDLTVPVFMPQLRIPLEMKNGPPICTFFMLKTKERMKSFLFSMPVNFFSGHRLYHLGGIDMPVELMTAKTTIKNVSSVLNYYNKTHIGIENGFSYGDHIDNDLNLIPKHQKQLLSSTLPGTLSIKMFFQGRFDWMISYPARIEAYLAGGASTPVQSFLIEGSPSHKTGHFMCNRHPVSEKFILSINNTLKTLYSQAPYLNAHTDFLPRFEKRLTVDAISQFQSTLLL